MTAPAASSLLHRLHTGSSVARPLCRHACIPELYFPNLTEMGCSDDLVGCSVVYSVPVPCAWASRPVCSRGSARRCRSRLVAGPRINGFTAPAQAEAILSSEQQPTNLLPLAWAPRTAHHARPHCSPIPLVRDHLTDLGWNFGPGQPFLRLYHFRRIYCPPPPAPDLGELAGTHADKHTRQGLPPAHRRRGLPTRNQGHPLLRSGRPGRGLGESAGPSGVCSVCSVSSVCLCDPCLCRCSVPTTETVVPVLHRPPPGAWRKTQRPASLVGGARSAAMARRPATAATGSPRSAPIASGRA